MNKPIFKVTPMNCARGAPMGRGNIGLDTMKSGAPMYLAHLPLNQGYDVGGAYWGTGDMMFVLFNDDLEYYFRARSMSEGIAELTKYGEPYTIIPTETDTVIHLAAEAGYTIVETEAGWRWEPKYEAYAPSSEYDTLEECFLSLDEYIGGDASGGDEDIEEAADHQRALEPKEVYKTVVISTAHISLADNTWLTEEIESGEYKGVVVREYGYDVYDTTDCRTLCLPNLARLTQHNIVRLFDAGYNHIVIDRDGDVIDGLTVWYW